ncbi:MAG: DUF2723 domain-containing protein [Clostridiales Family XIII bacterium]|nr:DUF2723 domain-containing protein [Clostridiales Family XIII bacterium]
MDNDYGTYQAPKVAIKKYLETILSSLDSCYTLAILALIITIFYIVCSSPLYGWRDSPEFAVTTTYLDVAHPSGYPTYSLLAKAATWLPLGSIGFRVTIFTAFAGGLSLFILALLLKRLHNLDNELPSALPWLFAPILILALDKAVFVSSTELEVYSLHTVFILILFYCATRWHEGSGIKWLYAGGFIYGLSSGNHGSMCLYLPVLLLLTFYGEPPKENDGNKLRHIKRLGLLVAFFLIGLSIYIYLIIRSNTGYLPVDFGHPRTLHEFWLHISDAKDSDYHFKPIINQEELFYLVKTQAHNLIYPIFWISIPFFLWGLKFLWTKFQIMSVALIILILINICFFYYWIDGSAAFIPSIFAYFILVSLGLGEVGRKIRGKKSIQPIVSVALVAVTIFSVISLGKNRLSELDTISGYQYNEMVFPDVSKVPPDSIIINSATWFPMLALQYVYAVRPDVSLIFTSGLIQPLFFSYPTPKTHPFIIFPKEITGELISPFSENFRQLFLIVNYNSDKAIFVQYGDEAFTLMDYLEPNPQYMWMGKLNLDYAAGWFALKNGEYDNYLQRTQKYFDNIKSDPNIPFSQNISTVLFLINRPVMEYTYQNKLYEGTAETIKKFLELFDGKNERTTLSRDYLLNSMALYTNSLRQLKKFNQAESVAFDLIKNYPDFYLNYITLANIYDDQNKGEDTLNSLRYAVELNPYYNNSATLYFFSIAKYHSISEAITFIDSHMAFLEKEGLYRSKRIMEFHKACLLLSPSKPDFN